MVRMNRSELRSPLHDRHAALGARMAPFAGWEMPIQYSGIVAEHKAVRESAGVFDISHMGEFRVSGPEASALVESLFTNDSTVLGDGEGQYTLMLNEGGGVIDDLILYRLGEEEYFLVVNAAKIEEDRDWIEKRNTMGACFQDQSENYGALAVQGPKVAEIWAGLAPDYALPDRNGIVEFDDGTVICRTGYTGEDGFELFCDAEKIGTWFDKLLEAGVVPCGLGARDTLRLEKCYPLNGSDLDGEHTPLEAGLGFFVKLDKEASFPGKEVLKRQKEDGLKQKLAAISVVGKAPPLRHDYEVRDPAGSEVLGLLTSGTISPTLGKGIGMAYLPAEVAKPGTQVSVSIRGRIFPAEVVKKPFV